jgi:peptide deformylase
MTVRQIRLFGDPCLKTASDSVTNFDEKTKTLIHDLLETTSLPGRAGVAAPQIGVNLRAFSYNVNGETGYLINPEIVEKIGEPSLLDEGCLSLPDVWSTAPRYPRVKIKGQNLLGEVFEIDASGLLAQVMQHETDHLDGLLYIDRLNPDDRKSAMAKLRQTSWFLKN